MLEVGSGPPDADMQEQLNTYTRHNLAAAGQSASFKGPSRAYRKIGEAGQGLECDDLFRAFMRKDVFRRVCERVHGKHCAISVYRAMVFNKPCGSEGGNGDEHGSSSLPGATVGAAVEMGLPLADGGGDGGDGSSSLPVGDGGAAVAE